ncbi:flagellar type III secretion system protein FlhB [Jannaschia sp. CCS1]|uniref:flagellar type III secretion system protein FlhB n=1 Tax=Jannaschia sp. (strain CCS1) TaxID=290400 RepID=UPI000053C801|nr:flagellar type III secretion system protein FlhB [Jannaschia sp. CCS1]ABD57105.1 flagellar biosynthetic protein FlhB [Jannaschia sp. CCS1]
MSDDDTSPGDKPFDATPKKLEDARKKGEIVRSQDLNTAVMYAGFLLSGAILAPWLVQNLGQLTQTTLGQAEVIAPLMLGPGGDGPAIGLLSGSLIASAAIVLVPAGLLLISLLAQRALLFTPSKLMPKLNRLSPISNAKQKYGSQGLFQFAKSAVKLALVSIFLAIYLWARAETILASLYGTAGQLLELLGRLSLDFLMVVAGMTGIIGIIDWFWEWSQLQLRNRMTRQEVMDESKSAEGDPHIKQQRRARGQGIAMNQMLGDVPNADVVVVNPTHYAVALKWDRAGGGVPICVAKGVDDVARRIREAASEAAVPIFSDPPTARALHASIEVGAAIQPDQYRAVAAAIRFADLMRSKAVARA